MNVARPKLAAPVAPARMTLAGITSGRKQVPLRVLVYGVPKVGKSTCAAGAPAPIFLGLDAGTEHLDVTRLPQPATWEDVLEGVALLHREKHAFKTLVVDPLNFFEPLCWTALCAKNGWANIEAPGYGKGYTAALDQWRVLLAEIERVWLAGMNVVFVAHATVKSQQNPEGADYSRYLIAMDPRPAGLFTGWVDAVLFAKHEAFVKTDGKSKAKGFSTGARHLYTTWNASYEAGNRWSLPEAVPLGWTELTDAISASEATGDALREEIRAVAARLPPEAAARAAGYIAAAGSNLGRLREILNAVTIKSKEQNT